MYLNQELNLNYSKKTKKIIPVTSKISLPFDNFIFIK